MNWDRQKRGLSPLPELENPSESDGEEFDDADAARSPSPVPELLISSSGGQGGLLSETRPASALRAAPSVDAPEAALATIVVDVALEGEDPVSVTPGGQHAAPDALPGVTEASALEGSVEPPVAIAPPFEATDVVLDAAHDGTFGGPTERQLVAAGEQSAAAAVHRLSCVHLPDAVLAPRDPSRGRSATVEMAEVVKAPLEAPRDSVVQEQPHAIEGPLVRGPDEETPSAGVDASTAGIVASRVDPASGPTQKRRMPFVQ